MFGIGKKKENKELKVDNVAAERSEKLDNNKYPKHAKRTNRVSQPRTQYSPVKNMGDVFNGAGKILKFLGRGTSVKTGNSAMVRMLQSKGIFY